jgi:hypothetical protein
MPTNEGFQQGGQDENPDSFGGDDPTAHAKHTAAPDNAEVGTLRPEDLNALRSLTGMSSFTPLACLYGAAGLGVDGTKELKEAILNDLTAWNTLVGVFFYPRMQKKPEVVQYHTGAIV